MYILAYTYRKFIILRYHNMLQQPSYNITWPYIPTIKYVFVNNNKIYAIFD